MSDGIALNRRRGQPVIVLVAITLGWIAMRAVLWNSPVAQEAGQIKAGAIAAALADAAPVRTSKGIAALAARESAPLGRAKELVMRTAGIDPPLPHREGPRANVKSRVTVSSGGHGIVLAPTISARADSALPKPPPRITDAVDGQSAARARPSKRWHVDGWYAWRPGSGQPRVVAGGPRAPAYGGTQGGIVARFDLAADARRPQLYLRATHAPAQPSQADLAVGFGVRPVATIPVRIQGEARATRTLGQSELRPAVAAITELAPAEISLGFRVEAYAQAGYVGGREATAFVDGQVRADRTVLTFGKADLRLGGGAWGGAQKYAERLDIGPGVTLDLRDAGVPARLSLDYRVRIAGHAHPSNGPALTFSTGF